jgi:hypothetical protein
MSSQKSVEVRLGQIHARISELESERAHLLSIYKANRRAQIAQTGEVGPLGDFLSAREQADFSMHESIAASNAAIDAKSALIRRG